MNREKLQEILMLGQRACGIFLMENVDCGLELWQSLAKTPGGVKCLPVRRAVFAQVVDSRTIQEEAQKWLGKEVL